MVTDAAPQVKRQRLAHVLTELAGRDIRWFLQTARTGFSRGVDPPIQIRPPCIRQPSMLDGAAITASAGPFSFRGGAQHARGVWPENSNGGPRAGRYRRISEVMLLL